MGVFRILLIYYAFAVNITLVIEDHVACKASEFVYPAFLNNELFFVLVTNHIILSLNM